jgi:large subunit ribosomal protein L7/L12
MIGDELKTVGDRIAGLTVAQAAGLADYLKQAHGIEAPRGVTVRVQADSTPVVSPPEQSSVVDVVLASAGEKKIQVIKIVRQHTGLGLKEAKDLVEGAPRIVKAGVERAEAEKIRAELVAQGASVQLK